MLIFAIKLAYLRVARRQRGHGEIGHFDPIGVIVGRLRLSGAFASPRRGRVVFLRPRLHNLPRGLRDLFAAFTLVRILPTCVVV